MADHRLPDKREADPGIVGEEKPQGIFPADVGLGYEATDASVRPLLWTTVAVFGIVILCYLALYVMYNVWGEREKAADRSLVPIARDFEQTPPAPRLQADPAAELFTWRNEEREKQESYAWADQGAGVAKMPIERAMEVVAERGLPTGEQWQMRPGDRFVHGVMMPRSAAAQEGSEAGAAGQASGSTGGAAAQGAGAGMGGSAQPSRPATPGGGQAVQ